MKGVHLVLIPMKIILMFSILLPDEIIFIHRNKAKVTVTKEMLHRRLLVFVREEVFQMHRAVH